MPNKNVGWLFSHRLQQSMEFLGHYAGDSRTWVALAPPISGAIVRTNPGKACDLRLHSTPIEKGAFEAVFEDHSWSTLSRAIQVKAIATNINQAAWRRIELCIVRLSPMFIHIANEAENNKNKKFGCQDATQQAQPAPGVTAAKLS